VTRKTQFFKYFAFFRERSDFEGDYNDHTVCDLVKWQQFHTKAVVFRKILKRFGKIIRLSVCTTFLSVESV